jgi:RHS repeat-associated protein
MRFLGNYWILVWFLVPGLALAYPANRGDLDDDGIPTVGDLVPLINHLTGLTPLPASLLPIADVDGNGEVNDGDLDRLTSAILGAEPLPPFSVTRLESTSPADGEGGVAITRETILRFNRALASDVVVDDGAIWAEFGGLRLETRRHLSPDRKTLTLFYDELLPSSARVRVQVKGDQLTDSLGLSVDADGDGEPGGDQQIDFDTLSLTILPGTSVVGRVFASEVARAEEGFMSVNEPLAGVVITVDGMEDTLRAVTDQFGDFRLEPAPAGRFFVHIDGREADGDGLPEGAYFPFVGKAWEAIPGEESSIGEVFLPLIQPQTLTEISESEETVVRLPDGVAAEFPEFAEVTLRVPPDSLFSDSGDRGGMVGIAPVPPDRLPGALPEGLTFPFVITVQTDGATNFDEPVPVCFPNLPDPETGEVLEAGAKSALWSFNHDTGQFEIVGPMTVSDDGTLVCSDPGFGILAPGWHSSRTGTSGSGGGLSSGSGSGSSSEPGSGSSPSGSPNTDDPCGENRGNGGKLNKKTDPIYLFSGEFYEDIVDLRIPGRQLDFVWSRKYRSQIGPNTRQGNGWDCSYNIFLEAAGEDLIVHDGNSRADRYTPQGDGTWGRREFFRELRQLADGSFELEFEDKGRWEFAPFDGTASEGKLISLVDRNGNALGFAYDNLGRLSVVTDTLDRDIAIEYNTAGFIASVTDFTGRSVRYEYYQNGEEGGSAGDLKSVTSPVIVGTSNGNDFPDGKTTSYTYSKGFADERLNHNLLTIVDGRRNDPRDPTFDPENPYLVNIYSATTDPDDPNFDRVVRQVWGNQDDLIDLVYVPLEPSQLNGLAVMRTIVNDRNGNVSEYFWDDGNRLVRERVFTGRAIPDQPTTPSINRPENPFRSSDPPFFETVTEWTEDSLQRRVVHPNGNITEYVYEGDLNPNASTRTRANLRVVRHLPGRHQPAGDQEVLEEFYEYDTSFGRGCCGFNFVTRHTDARGNTTVYDYDERGNRLRVRHRLDQIIEEYEYNEFGQMVAHVWAANNDGHRRRDEYVFYEEGPQRGYQQAEIHDAAGFGLTTTYEYDAVGNIVRVTDPRGGVTDFELNALNQIVRSLSREVSPESGTRYVTDWFFDANHNLKQIDLQNVDENGQVRENEVISRRFEYEILNRMVREISEVDEEERLVVEYDYDRNRNMVQTRTAVATNGEQEANVMVQVYDERDLLFRQSMAAGHPLQSTNEHTYDANGNLILSRIGIEDNPRLQSMTYDGFDRLVGMTDPMGNEARYQLDPNGNVIRVEKFGESPDLPGSQNNILMGASSFAYDAMDRQTVAGNDFFDALSGEPISDGESVYRKTYSNVGRQLVAMEDDNGNVMRFFYDTMNRLRASEDAMGNRQEQAYDANSNRIGLVQRDRSDLSGEFEEFGTSWEYDGLDRVVAETDSVGNRMIYRHDSRDNVVETIDPLGNRVVHEFDGLNRPVAVSRILTDTGDGSGREIGRIVTRQDWDGNSRVLSRTDGAGNRTSYAYDPLNRLVRVLYADGTDQTMRYDVHSNMIGATDPKGTESTGTYDLLNRLTRREVVPGQGVATTTTFEDYQYDGMGRLVRAEDNNSLVTMAHDSLSNLIRETIDGQSTSMTHDGMRNLLRCVYPGGREILCQYDANNRISRIADTEGNIAEYQYVGENRVEQVSLGNGVTKRLTYNGARGRANAEGDLGVRQATSVSHVDASGNVLDERNYRWDSLYNKSSRESSVAGELDYRFERDSVYRLTQSERRNPTGVPASVSDVLGASVVYEWDDVGNRRSVEGGSFAGDYQMEAGVAADSAMNQYTTTPFDSRTYDVKGNLLSTNGEGGRNFEYDYRDRLVRVTNSSGAEVASYRYDSLGRRVEKTVGENSTKFFYLLGQVVEEQNSDDETTASYVYGNNVDEVLQIRHPLEEFYPLGEDNYNLVKVTDGAGEIVERYEYDDFGFPVTLDSSGQRVEESTIGNPYAFTGRRVDPETGLYYYRSRYYDPAVGRFISRDSLGIWGDQGNVGNGAAYVGNRPWTLADPSGQAPNRRSAIKLSTWVKRIRRAERLLKKKLGHEPTPLETMGYLTDRGEWKYIYTKNGGWIDTHHFIASAYHARNLTETSVAGRVVGGFYGFSVSFAGGVAVEFLQLGNGFWRVLGFRASEGSYSSAFTSEDIPSDFYGAMMGSDAFLSGWRDSPYGPYHEPLSKTIEVYFEAVLDAAAPQDAPDYNTIAGCEEEHEAKANPPGYWERAYNWVSSWFSSSSSSSTSSGPSDLERASNRSYCFVAGTAVLTPAGQVPIEELKLGDVVLSWDASSNEVVSSSVERLFESHSSDVQVLLLGGHRFEVTNEHPFYHRERGWTRVGDLSVGDEVMAMDGAAVKVESIGSLGRAMPVYTIRVKETHNYFVGERGVLVHNK